MVNKKTLKNLIVSKTKWKNLPTKNYRIPEIIADKTLNYAHKIDNNIARFKELKNSENFSYNNLTVKELKQWLSDFGETDFKQLKKAELIELIKSIIP